MSTVPIGTKGPLLLVLQVLLTVCATVLCMDSLSTFPKHRTLCPHSRHCAQGSAQREYSANSTLCPQHTVPTVHTVHCAHCVHCVHCLHCAYCVHCVHCAHCMYCELCALCALCPHIAHETLHGTVVDTVQRTPSLTVVYTVCATARCKYAFLAHPH